MGIYITLFWENWSALGQWKVTVYRMVQVSSGELVSIKEVAVLICVCVASLWVHNLILVLRK